MRTARVAVVLLLAITGYASCYDDLLGDATCGKFSKHPGNRVIGGKDIKPSMWPSQVAIYRDSKLFCGGTIISKEYVITTAACIDDDRAHYDIMAGIHHLSGRDKYEQKRHFQVVRHHDYNGNHNNLLDNIALLKLEFPLEINDRVKPACLPTEDHDMKPGLKVTIVGWGATKNLDWSNEHEYPHSLKETELPLLNLKKCKSPNSEINDEHNLCAGSKNGSISGCSRDQGGPLLVRRENRWFIYGLMSLFKRNCDGTFVSTKTSAYAEWIKNTVHTDSDTNSDVAPDSESHNSDS